LKTEVLSLIGVDYLRLKTEDGGDLFLTSFGLPFREHLAPGNWHAAEWFDQRRIRLQGTSTIYRVPTRPVHGVSLDLVVRYSRVGQEVPLGAPTLRENIQSEFNSPFEEFALVMALRKAHLGPSQPRILTKRPLAIYVPAEELQDWQTGRLESKLAAKRARHPEVELDKSRHYILLYGWIEGLNAVQAMQVLGLTGALAERFLAENTLRMIHDLKQHGFRVLDINPEHVILRVHPDGSLLRQRDGTPASALVDYELLERL
jgi:hypothetical protein